MELDILNLIIPVITSFISGFLAYISARSQNKAEVEKVNISYQAEIDKLKFQQQFDLEQFKQQQELEIIKIKEQYTQEIQKLSVEIDKQAELYEKNAQTDMVKSLFGDVMKGDTRGLENLMNIADQLDKFKK